MQYDIIKPEWVKTNFIACKNMLEILKFAPEYKLPRLYNDNIFDCLPVSWLFIIVWF